MTAAADWRREHLDLTRRYFLQLGAGAAAWGTLAASGTSAFSDQTPADGTSPAQPTSEEPEYLTLPDKFGTVERGNPLPYKLPEEQLRAVGLVRETWQLEILADPEAPPKLESSLTKEQGNALDWGGLMKLAETRAVRFLKVMTCNNGSSPLGMGLWEGVPLRDLVWLTKPVGDLRRVYYYGYHNDDPKQRFQSSLPIGRVLEDPPGELPVIVAYKLNGEWLSGKRGGPARVIVPEAYGFKSVKWLTRVVLTNAPFANDTYANGNNDVDSAMKSFARFAIHPRRVKPGESIPVSGLAQVGLAGVSRVELAFHPRDAEPAADDPHLTRWNWLDAKLLAAPRRWGGGLPDDDVRRPLAGFDPQTQGPQTWPMRYTLAHWAALAPPLPPGAYWIACRTIDERGVAQPLPRPFPKSGRNIIQQVELDIEPA